ncbi:MAG: magnesium chelatase subunit D, partial [Betaproteobacteria bacterium]
MPKLSEPSMADPLQDGQTVALSTDAAWAAALLAVDPIGLGGVCLRAGPGPWREAWLDRLRTLLPAGTPWRRMPAGISDSALLGGLDLAATLSRGQPVLQPGLLSQAHGGFLLLTMAERTGADLAGKLAAVIDTRQLQLQRDGLAQQLELELALIALDEGLDDDEALPPSLLDRLGFWLQAPQPDDEQQALLQVAELEPDDKLSAADVLAARARLPQLRVGERQLQALCATAVALGIDSLRPPLLAAKAARVAAALEGAEEVSDAHAALAARLILAPRATRLPPAHEQPQDEAQEQPPSEQEATPPPDEATPAPPNAEQQQNEEASDEQADLPSPEELQEMMIAAAQASLSPGLLAALRAGKIARQTSAGGGRAGAAQKNLRRGRPLGAVRGALRDGARLNVLATLRAAAPWQALRKQARPAEPASEGLRRIEVRRDDFHIMRFKQQRSTTTVFVVDASGSSALHRLAEAKGAVELLLADCYVRRDRVAVISFRGAGAEVLLPPTRSLARAKRSLAGLPGGGGTPLASALDAAHSLAGQIARSGDTPVVVVLTDGRANIARDGSPGRAKAGEDAQAAARAFALADLPCLLIDTSAQPQP